MITTINEPWLTATDVARLFKVHQTSVSRWVYEGRLDAARTPGGQLRFRESDVIALLEKCGMIPTAA